MIKLRIKNWVAIYIPFFMVACNSDPKIPDVSNIKLDLKVDRFEKDFFSINNNNIEQGLDAIQLKYGSFTQDYLYYILGSPGQKDSAIKFTKYFITDTAYINIKKDCEKKFTNFDALIKEVELAFKLNTHYFPKYKLPKKIITFVGPLNGVACAITSNQNIAIGLQGFLGSSYAAYNTQSMLQDYPLYKTKRFEAAYISSTIMKNIIDDMFPSKFASRPLVEQMVELGKKTYLLKALLPNTADTVITGYTKNQLSECYNNEAFIFSFFVQNNLLFEKEPSLIMPFVNDGPKTPELSETAPGNIGQFIGWQIVKKWMKQNPKITVEMLMNTTASTIFNEVKYKP